MREALDIDSALPLPLTLSQSEVQLLTGYKIPSKQLQELRLRGFSRAYQNRSGKIIVERAHFEAVAAGAAPQGPEGGDEPKLRPCRREKGTKNG